MPKVFSYIGVLLLMNAMCFQLVAQEEALQSDALQIINRFIEASGGKSQWTSIETMEVLAYKELLDSSDTSYQTLYYKSEPATFVQKDSSHIFMHTVDGEWLYDDSQKVWKDLTSFRDKTGSGGFNHRFISHALFFVKGISQLSFLKKSEKDFGIDHEVVELSYTKSVYDLFKMGKCKYLLFSKKTGLLDKVISYKDGEEFFTVKFSDYQNINGFIIPTKREEAYNVRNKLYFAFPPMVITYTKVKFNQPIPNSVFERN